MPDFRCTLCGLNYLLTSCSLKGCFYRRSTGYCPVDLLLGVHLLDMIHRFHSKLIVLAPLKPSIDTLQLMSIQKTFCFFLCTCVYMYKHSECVCIYACSVADHTCIKLSQFLNRNRQCMRGYMPNAFRFTQKNVLS